MGITAGVLWGYVRGLDFVFTELYNIFDNIQMCIRDRPCTTCKDICPYGEEIFTRPNLVKDWDPCTDCGLCVSACRSGRCV